ncbi:hypothetical protein BO85DRAFT_199913 [Aspergillus piperis CBS 112811]|uniref:Uncharacterized protein n=1 Tax=Aspergillus piperis CBS 112811 TaxID=1448313 RepID=A0A8G1VHV4_9EURO|nr:hypothetical protein BO85DRAFT_199913 [Aspergillus piperis CBS 112811]RAH52612.1 hypothetical protein BO85DRAFT_199913 [Aspergillus piperis CBS 112811]
MTINCLQKAHILDHFIGPTPWPYHHSSLSDASLKLGRPTDQELGRITGMNSTTHVPPNYPSITPYVHYFTTSYGGVGDLGTTDMLACAFYAVVVVHSSHIRCLYEI